MDPSRLIYWQPTGVEGEESTPPFNQDTQVHEDTEALERAAQLEKWAASQLEEGVLKEEIRDRVKVKIAEKREHLLRSDEHQAELVASFESRLIDLDEIEDPEPLIDGMLTKDSLARTFGPPKSLKSFVTLDMAACVSLGIPWKGRTTHKVPVLYIVAEGARGMKKRRRAWNAWHDRPMDVIFYPEPVQINEDRAMREVIAFCKAREVGYVIFDTQARCTVGVDENSNTEMGQVVRALDVLKQETGACVHVVHHSGAGSTDRGRGATAFDGAVDTEFRIEREEDSDGVSVISRFQKDMAEAEPVDMIACEIENSLIVTDGGASLNPDAARTEPPLPEISKAYMGYLRVLGGGYTVEGATHSNLRDEMGIPANGSGRSKVTKALDKLQREGVVIKNKKDRYFLTKLGSRVVREQRNHEYVEASAPRATQTRMEEYDE